MNQLKRAARATLAASVMAAVAACSGNDVDETPPTTPPAKMITVSVGVANFETMTYTDPASPDGVTTVPTTDGDGRWGIKSVEVTVPAGTTVRVQGNGARPVGASCWITDPTGQLKLAEGTDVCSTVAE